MKFLEFINQYYIHVVTGYLVLLAITVIIVLLIKPFPSFKDSALYDIFSNSHIVLSVTYSSVFVISLVLSIENVFDLRNMIKRNRILELKTISRKMNLSKVVVDEDEKAMMDDNDSPIKRSQVIMLSPSPSSKSMSSDNRNRNAHGEAKIILANFFMIIAFLLPSSLILFSSRYFMNYCNYY